MSNYRRARTNGGSYFFTVVTHHRHTHLIQDSVRLILRHAIQQTRHLHPFTIDAWVLLPDHLHAIWTLPEHDCDYSKRWGLIKAYVSKHAKILISQQPPSTLYRQRHENTFWQRRFWEHQIRDDRDFRQHIDYIHFNPVKHGLVSRVVDWPYSSFHRFVKHGVYPGDWGRTVELPDTGFGE